MALNFPSSPTLNQQYTFGDKTWIWNGYAWDIQGVTTTTTVATDTFTGNGTTTAFTLSVAPTSGQWVIVNYDGVLQLESSYTVSGTTITFAEAPASGSTVEVRTVTFGIASGGGGGAIAVSEDGVEVTAAATSLNFTGAPVAVTADGGAITVDINNDTAVTVTGANQPNITSVGTLTSLNVSGDVGIGTTTPGKQLDIANTNVAELRVRTTVTPVDVQLGAEYFSYGAGYVGTTTDHAFEIRSGGFPRAIFHTDGRINTLNANVGLDVFFPTEKLDVSGNVKATGFIGSGAGLTSLPAANVTGNLSGITNITASGSVTLSGGTANGVAYLNGSKVLTTGSALTFDGTNIRLNDVESTIPALTQGMYVGSTTNNAVVGYSLRVQEGTNNRRGSMFLDDSTGVFGWDVTASTGVPEYAWRLAGTERMRLDSLGNLGLGVAPTAAWSSLWRVQQLPNGYIGSTESQAMAYGVNNYYDGSTYRYTANGFASQYQQSGSGTHFWRYAASGTAGAPVAFTIAMTLDNVGRLGIGTTSPGARLDVNGSNGIVVQDTSLTASQVNIGVSLLTAGRPFVGTNTNSNPLEVGTRTTADLIFVTNSAERARIDSSGNLGIGINSPQAKLDVRGFTLLGNYGGTFQGVTLRNNDDSSASTTVSFIDAQNNLQIADTNLFFGHQTDGGSYIAFATTPPGSRSSDRRLERVRINPSGNVGIGTTAPLEPLDVFTDALIRGVTFRVQAAPPTFGSSTTLTAAQLLTGLLVCTSGVTLTLPAASTLFASMPQTDGAAFDFSVISTSSTVTMQQGTDWDTTVGNSQVTSSTDRAAVFRARFNTATGKATLYRIA